jgi:4'-phosphopantetheinyl transferase
VTPQGPPDRRPNPVPQVVTVDLSGMESVPPDWLVVLDDGEIRRGDSFFRPGDRLTFVAAHALKRLALAQAHPERNAKALRFTADSFGKPFLAERVSPQFNISHTTGLVALAVSFHTPVGIDVETLGSPSVSRDLMRSVLTSAEREAVESAADWEHAFLDFWTAKEAVIKAEGKGLSLPLSEIEIGQDSALGPSRHWTLWRSQPTPRHVLALAWHGGDNAVDNHALYANDLTAWIRDEATMTHLIRSLCAIESHDRARPMLQP